METITPDRYDYEDSPSADLSHEQLASLMDEVALLREQNQALMQEANRDRFLSSMLHKKAFIEDLDSKLNDKYVGLFFIDINKFKTLNDTEGHVKADKLLDYIAHRLDETFRRKGDTLATDGNLAEKGRMGGDEFAVSVVLSENGSRSTDPLVQMDNIYDLLKEIETDIVAQYPGIEGLGLSIGSELYDPNNPVDTETFLQQVDQAMYEEKPETTSTRN